MSEDWQAGDMALCVRGAKPCSDCGLPPLFHAGAVYTVKAFRHIWLTGAQFPALFFEELADETRHGRCTHYGFIPHHFRKIRPHVADKEDAETIRLLQAAPAEMEPLANDRSGYHSAADAGSGCDGRAPEGTSGARSIRVLNPANARQSRIHCP